MERKKKERKERKGEKKRAPKEMADLDEENPASAAPNVGETDLSDETQDFRFLERLSQ